MGSLVQDAVGDQFKVECVCKLNAGLGDVKNFEGLTKGFSKEDHVVVIGKVAIALIGTPITQLGKTLKTSPKPVSTLCKFY